MTSIIEKLQKLINHERSAREIGNLEEAEAFTAKIQTILTQHKLTMSEVEFEAQDTVDPIGTDEVELSGKSTPTWQLYLSQSIARNFFCMVLGVKGANRQAFVGRDSDRTAAVEMFRYLVSLALSFSKQEADAYMNGPDVLAVVKLAKATTNATGAEIKKEMQRVRRRFEAAFLIGFGHAIFTRLDATRKDLNATASSQATGLILRDAAAIKEFAQHHFSFKKQLRKPSVGHAAGFHKGMERGNATSLKGRTSLHAGS